jgi:catechol 2,3-dioxygenase-like lactoylglutathione lyase family enzyme
MDLRLELVTVPTADIDPSEAFYVDSLGFSVEQGVRVDGQHRFVELVPPGSLCSIALTAGYIETQPGALQGLQVNVDSADAVHARLVASGVAVSELQAFPWSRFCCFSDPDGNGWSVHGPVGR